MTSDSLKASASIITAFHAAPDQNGLCSFWEIIICEYYSYSWRMSLSTVLFPAPIPPPMKRRTGLLSLWSTGAITSVHCESSTAATPIALNSSTNVLKTLATFRIFLGFCIYENRRCHLTRRYTLEMFCDWGTERPWDRAAHCC